MDQYSNFSSMPPEEERQFVGFERVMRESLKKGMVLGVSIGCGTLLVLLIIIWGVEPPPNELIEDLAADLAEEPSSAPAPAPTPAPAPKAAPAPTPAPAGTAPPTEAPPPPKGATKAPPTAITGGN